MTVQARNELALVTGGAVRLGREIALALAQAGYSIALHYYSSHQAAEATAREIKNTGVDVHLFQADLRNPINIQTLFDQIADLSLPLRVLINSASIMPQNDIRNMGVSQWDDTLDLNLRAPWLCSQAAAVLMQDDGGVIINISDSGARKTWTGYPVYTISKAGLEVLTKLLARSLAPKIRVNAVAPGLILPSQNVSAQTWQKLEKRLPAGHSGSPKDVSKAVLFLIENSYITGETLMVDGGYQLV